MLQLPSPLAAVSNKEPSRLPLGVLAAAAVLFCGAGLLFVFIAAPPPGAPTAFGSRPGLRPLQALADRPGETIAAAKAPLPLDAAIKAAEANAPKAPASLHEVDPPITGALPPPLTETLPRPASPEVSQASAETTQPAKPAKAAETLPASEDLTPADDPLQIPVLEAPLLVKVAGGGSEPLTSLPAIEVRVETRDLAKKSRRDVADKGAEPKAALKVKPMMVGRDAATDAGSQKEKLPAPRTATSARGYSAKIYSAIARHRRRIGGLTGRATVAFSVGPGGGLQAARITRSSGKPQLDQAALSTVRSAAPFPAPPPGAKASYSIQIYFR
jgi:protein TonB